MNLIKALGSLSPAAEPGKDTAAEAANRQPPPPPEPEQKEYNAMASVLERHERIANRVRSNSK